MFKSVKVILCTGFIFLMLVMTGQAQPQFSVGVKGGTMGIGGEVSTSLQKFEKLNARLSGTFFSYNLSGVEGGSPSIAYDAELSITSIGLIADYFPFKRSLKLSAGVFYYDFSVAGSATPNKSYTISGKTFEPSRLGSLSADIGYKSNIVPYAGIGLGNPLAKGSRLKLNFEIGAVYTDSPQVSMQGTGLIAPTAQQDQSFQDGLRELKFYPVLNLGLSYRIK